MPRRQLLRYSLPLFLDTLAKRLLKRLDLWAVQGLAGATAAGHYGAAISVDTVGRTFTQAITRVVLATVSDSWAQGQKETARGIIRQSLRLSLWLLPFAALGAGAAPALVTLVFGPAYLPAAALLGWLSFATVAYVVVSVTAAVFAAIERPGAAFVFNGPVVVLAVAGYLVLVPRMGGAGAAVTTAASTWVGAWAGIVAVHRWCHAGPGRGTWARIILTSTIAYGLPRAWQVEGGWVIPQLLGLSGVVLLLMFALGEITRRDLDFALSLLRREPPTRGHTEATSS
jgi:O-antigen/teichoic acid export membrane protein